MNILEKIKVILSIIICLLVILFLYLIFKFGILIALEYFTPILGILFGFISISGIGTLISVSAIYVNKQIELLQLSQKWIEISSENINNYNGDEELKKSISTTRKTSQQLFCNSAEYLQEINEFSKFSLHIIKSINKLFNIQNPYKKDL